jgi:hypothetical protein
MAKATYPTDPTEVVAFIGNIADLLCSEGVRIVALQEFFNGSDTDAAVDSLHGYEEQFVAGLLRGAAIEAIHMACMRAFDKADPDRWTIRTAQLLLTESPNFEAVVNNGGDREMLGHFMRLAEETETDGSLKRLRVDRDSRLAHHLRDKFAQLSEKDRADLRDLWYAVDDVLLIIYHLVAGTGRVTASFEADRVVWRQRNAAFWRRLIEGPRGCQ